LNQVENDVEDEEVTTGEDGKEKGIQMRPSFYWRINQRGN
jgi:hypothetical protein